MNKEIKFIDDNSYYTIEGKETFDLIELYSTPGKILIREYQPMKRKDIDICKKKYISIQRLMDVLEDNSAFHDKLKIPLSHIESLNYTFECVKNSEVLENTQLFEIKQFIFFLRQIYKQVIDHNLKKDFPLNPLDSLWELLDIEGKETPHFFVSNRYSKKLQRERLYLESLMKDIETEKKHITDKINKELNFTEAKEVIVLSRMNKNLIEKLDKSKLYTKIKQNFANMTYEIVKTTELLELEYKKDLLINKIKDEEYKVRTELSENIKRYIDELIQNTNIIADLDLKLAKAKYAIDNNCVIPTLHLDKKIRIKNGRNLFIEKDCRKKNLHYYPINIEFNKNTVLITGSNMGGKSTLLKTIGNLFFHISYAIPIPAESAELPLVDFIYFSVDTNREGQTGLSSFGSEMHELNYYVNIKNRFGLYLIDEFARGTNPFEGEAFCSSILQFLKKKYAMTLCVSHFSEPTKIKNIEHFQVIGLSQVDKKALKKELEHISSFDSRLELLNQNMDYNLKKVKHASDVPHEALTVAELLGVNEEILIKVKEMLDNKGWL